MSAASTLQPIERTTISDTVADRLRAEILAGHFAPRSKLPPERELAETLMVNRLTIRSALARLETQGLIVTQHGTGSIVQDFRESAGVEMFPDLVRVMRARDPKTFTMLLRDALDLRRTFASEAVALAAERHAPEDLEAIRALTLEQRARVRDVLAFARADLDIARAVVRCTKNLGLELLLNTIVRMPLEDAELLHLLYPSPRTQCKHYEALLALIASRDPTQARAVMTAALEAIDRITLRRLARRKHADAAAPQHSPTTTGRKEP